MAWCAALNLADNNKGCNTLYFNRVASVICYDVLVAAYQAAPEGVLVMKQKIIVRKKQAAELRRMAEAAKEVERERKLLALADVWEEDAQRLEEALPFTK